ncbi:hypothetical protein MMC28_000428, partial [Mycoblastus sanguinarius]|nr:hypothetical protein [Mycoblastus sanguinarius]
MILLSSLAIVLFSASQVNAFSAFIPNCTIPSVHHTWISEPQVRGTMNIIWSCFSVLLLCTWTIQHLHVPPHIEPKKHSWNVKFYKDARYSAFLDDFRFNVTKLKWMMLSFLAPEYILAKALAEFLAARESRRQFADLKAHDPQKQFEDKEWTTTHAYFANMRGFVLRFDVEAVKMPLEPHKPDELGRSLQNPNPSGDPPYFEQDARRAETIELSQCEKICGLSCKCRPDQASKDERGLSPSSRPSPEALSPVQNGSIELHSLKVEANSQPEAPGIEVTQLPTSPRDFASRKSDDLTAISPSTLVNATPISMVHRHGFRNTNTQTTMEDDHDFPFPGSMTPNTPANGRGYHRLQTTKGFVSHEDLMSDTPTAIDIEQAKLGPHEKWKATWALSSMQMYYAYKVGIMPLPDVTAEDLNDRSKGDALVKGAAVMQITWLVIQIIARAFQHLAISQLEITVLAFAACAIVTYFLLWHKPQDVKVPIYIDIPNVLTRQQIIQLAARSPVSNLVVHQFWLHGVAVRTMNDVVFPWTRGIKINLPGMKEPTFLNPVFTGIGLGGAIFGGIHFAAWDFAFPSRVEALLWRISSSWLVVFPLT